MVSPEDGASFDTPKSFTREIVAKMEQDVGTTFDLVAVDHFDTGHTQGVAPLLDMGVLRPPLQFSFIVNVLGGIPPHVESLQLQTKIMPPASEWEVIGISHGQWRMLGAALVLGGNIRCGLEDHLYLPNGEMARSNGDLIAQARRMAEDVGRRPATVAEARDLLGVPKRAAV